MPGRQKRFYVENSGLAFTIEPGFWLRRRSHFPFYFESHNPTFRVRIERVIEKTGYEWSNNNIPFDIEFADGTKQTYVVPVPSFKGGNVEYEYIRSVYAPHPGQTIIRIALSEGQGKRTFQTAFSYQVRTEESLWVSVGGAILLLFVAVITGLVSQPNITITPNITVYPVVRDVPTITASQQLTPNTASSPP